MLVWFFLNMVATSGVCYNIRCVPIFSKSMMMFGSLDFLLRADYRSKWQEPKNVFLWMLKFSTSEIEAVKAAASELEDFDEDEEEEDEEDEEDAEEEEEVLCWSLTMIPGTIWKIIKVLLHRIFWFWCRKRYLRKRKKVQMLHGRFFLNFSGDINSQFSRKLNLC